MRRFHQEVPLMRARARFAERHVYYEAPPPGLGRWRKRHPLDCGRRCCLCHFDKLVLPKRRGARKREAIRYELDAG